MAVKILIHNKFLKIKLNKIILPRLLQDWGTRIANTVKNSTTVLGIQAVVRNTWAT